MTECEFCDESSDLRHVYVDCAIPFPMPLCHECRVNNVEHYATSLRSVFIYGHTKSLQQWRDVIWRDYGLPEESDDEDSAKEPDDGLV
jgi:hypothetical protein